MSFFLLLCVLACVATTAPAGAVDSAKEVVAKLQARYDAMKDFTAAVTQDMEIASLGRTLSSHGSVLFKRPGLMRWEMENHDKQIIVADGENLWVYQPAEKQVYKASFKQAFRSTTPVSFLIGIGRIEDDFQTSLDGEKDGLVYLRLVPRKGGDIGKLRLGVDAKTFDIREAEIQDPLGNTTRLHFDDIKRDVGLVGDSFRFSVPPGTEVVEAPPGTE